MKIEPYVGENYDKYRILLVGESHYIKDELDKYEFDLWYEKDLQFSDRIASQFNTNKVVGQFLNHAKGTFAIYRFPAMVLAEALNTDIYTAFTYTAFYNYFQRPNLGKRSFTSIYLDSRDFDYAYVSFKTCLSMLNPKLVIFLSKKAYLSLCNYEQPANVHCLVHPASAWWFRKHCDKEMKQLVQQLMNQ